jgi:hypothetical protein
MPGKVAQGERAAKHKTLFHNVLRAQIPTHPCMVEFVKKGFSGI